MFTRNEALISLWGLVAVVIVCVYCAVMISLTSNRLKFYEEMAIKNHEMILQNQRLAGEHMEQFVEWMAEQDNHMDAQDKEFTKILKNQERGLSILESLRAARDARPAGHPAAVQPPPR